MNDHLLVTHWKVFVCVFEYTEILDLQLSHVHLTVSVTVKRRQIRTSIIIRVSQNEHQLWRKFEFNISISEIQFGVFFASSVHVF